VTDSINITSNSPTIAREFRVQVKRLQVGIGPLTAKYGALLLTKVRANASGRPGPRAITGDYRRSWTLRLQSGAAGERVEPGTVSAVVGTNRPQARRLEFGFVGVDALGRHYDQPPYPHAAPALDAVGPEFGAAVFALVSL
jgi:hypothetical protein